MGWQDDEVVPAGAAGSWQNDEIVQPTQPSAEDGGFFKDLGRAAAMQAGAFVKGASNIVALPTDAVVRLLNAVGVTDWKPAAESIGEAIDSITPQPQNSTERVANAVVGSLGGAAGGIRSGLALGGAVGEALSAAPAGQAIAAGAGAAAGQLTAESGGTPAEQLIASTVGSLSPSLGRFAGAAGTKAAFRGGEAGRLRTEQNIKDFEAVGAQPSAGQATGSRRVQAVESALSKIPGGAGQMAKRAEAQASDIGQGVERLANRLAPNSSGEQAGRKIQRGVSGEGGFVEKFKAKQEQLYDQLDEYISQEQGISVENTSSVLASLNPTIKGAPSTSKLFQNSRIKGIESAVKDDLDLAPQEARARLDATLRRIDELYASRDAARQDQGRFQAFEAYQGNRVDSFSPVPGMPRFPGRYTPHEANRQAGRSAAQDADFIASSRTREAADLESTIAELQANVEAASGKLPYQAVKKLRTLVGQELADAGLVSDVPRSKWKALYSALSSDLEGAASAAGPEATAAFARANNYTRAGMKRLEVLDSVIDKAGGPEAIFRAATNGTREGASTLRAVMQSLPEEAQKTVSATVLRRLGRTKPGQQAGENEFSTETFLTNWNTLSKEAKATLFNRFGNGFRQDMDTVANVAANLRKGSKVFVNPSGTAQATANIGALATFAGALGSGNVPLAASIASGAGAANLSARLLTHPPFVKWLAKSAGKPKAAIPALLNSLAQQSRNDPLLSEAAEYFQQTIDQQSSNRDPAQ